MDPTASYKLQIEGKESECEFIRKCYKVREGMRESKKEGRCLCKKQVRGGVG